MYDLILDPTTMNPHLKYLIPNSIYYTCPGNMFSNFWNGGETIPDLFNKYKINLEEELKIINNVCIRNNKFNNMYFSLSILSTEEIHQGKSNKLWIEYYKTLYNKFIPFISGKIIIIDNHGGDYEPTVYLNKFNFKYDIILKRIYSNRNNNNYLSNTFSYPFIMDTNNDPLIKLYNLPILSKNVFDKINKIFWAGSLFEYHEEWDNNNTYEHTDRIKIVNSFNTKYQNILDIKRVPYNLFHETMCKYKYALDIRGTSRLNKRLYEIFSTNTLLLAEKIDIIWPFENNDKFSDECFFEQGNVDDLYRIYNNFENNFELYDKCLKNQMYIVKKYFNNEWLWAYIQDIIN
tara:strand:- start:1715 stop:2755 length:1041 start_codon:yes stop_codon:yes gene_type:complete